ncbi:MAG: insulinase family protein, partial [Muribaculaceae bacterium]|nr:insulinase family protein [Muribaculaceae bacterium]
AMMRNPTLATLDAANYPKMLGMIKEILGNAADYTFIFTGNVDVETLKPLLEQYIATLPTGKVNEVKEITSMKMAEGTNVSQFKQKMQTPATMVFDIFSDNNLPYNQRNSVMVDMVADVLDIIFTETLREEEGGTYGAGVGSYLNPNTGYWALMYQFTTNKEQQQSLIDRAQAEWLKLLKEGANEEQFNKVKQAMLKQLEINEKTNGYWNSNLMSYMRGIDMITGMRQTIENVTLTDLNKFMKSLYNGKNRIEVVMEGIEE